MASHDPPATNDDGDPGRSNRGSAARIAPNGEVRGSGAGAGGGGAPEDFDSDIPPGAAEMPTESGHPDKGGDAPNHGSR